MRVDLRRIVGMCLVLAAGLAVSAARASYVDLDCTPSVFVTGGTVRVTLAITNVGDETACNVAAVLELGASAATSGVWSVLEVGGGFAPAFEVPAPATPGIYTAVARLRFTDRNGYALSAVRTFPVATGGAADAERPFDAFLEDTVLVRAGWFKLHVEPYSEKPFDVTATLVLPDEFMCPIASQTVTLIPGQEATAVFPVSNLSALPGSVYGAHAVVSTRAGGTNLSLSVEADLVVDPPWFRRLPLRPLAGAVTAALLLAFAVVQFLPRRRAATRDAGRSRIGLGAAVLPVLTLAAVFAFTLWHLSPANLLRDTMTVGGDTPAHNYLAGHVRGQLLHHGRVVSWAGGWWGGFPMFQYYFPLPYVLAALLSLVIPFNIAFKLVTVIGGLMLPACAYASARTLRFPRPVPILTAIAMVPLLFDHSNTMWGVNLYSTLAGMIANSISFPLMLLAIARATRDADEGRFRLGTALLLAALLASHFFTSVMAALTLAVVPLLRPRAGLMRALTVLAAEGGLALLLMAWWLVPLFAKRDFSIDFGENWNVAWHDVPRFAFVLLPLTLAGLVTALRDRRRFAAIPAIMFFASLFLFLFGYDYVSPVFVNVRLWPFMIYALLALAALGAGRLVTSCRANGLFVSAALVAALGLATGAHENVRGWADWNYRGIENTPRYAVMRDLVLPLDGTPGRLANDLHDENNSLGSSRVFECVPHLIDKPILEGGLVNSAAGSLYAYYIQGETSRNCAGFPSMVTPTTFNVTNATRHLELFNVKHFIARWEGTKDALNASPKWKRLGASGPWELHELLTHEGRYVTIPRHAPVAVRSDRWKELSLEWLYDIDAVDYPVALLPARSAMSRAFGPAMTESAYTNWLRAPVAADVELPEGLSPGWSAITRERVTDDRITFHTRAVGAPHIVACTYFPNWQVRGASRIYMVSPCFMLVYPTQADVEIYYGTTLADRIGHNLAGLGVGLAVAAGAWRFVRRRAERGTGAATEQGSPS